MNAYKLRVSALTIAALLVPGMALAATSTASTAVIFTMGQPTAAMKIDELARDLGRYEHRKINELVDAKAITEFKLSSAYTGADATKATTLLTTDKKAIDELRVAIKKDPKAVKLLEDNKLKVDDVAGIIVEKTGVSIYVL
jgi:hypothetical protein